MGERITPAQPATRSDAAAYLLAIGGLAASITLTFLAMRAVMDIGGSCAKGGPLDQTPCPEGIPLLMAVAVPALFIFGGLMASRGSRLGEPYAAAVVLAWPVLFLSLGVTFLQYGLWPPDGDGVAWGWLVSAAVFAAIGAGPLVLGMGGLSAAALRDLGRAHRSWLALLVASAVAGATVGFLLFSALAD